MKEKDRSSLKAGRKPIVLYDHLPEILAGYPAVLFSVLGVKGNEKGARVRRD